MKLLGLIVKNVKREDIHPSANFFVQDWGFSNDIVNCFIRKPDNKESDVEWKGFGFLSHNEIKIGSLSEDAATTIITREELMRAYDLVEQGYTLWFGGECPVGDTVIVDVALRDYPSVERHFAVIKKWSNDGISEDVIAYKVAYVENTQIEVAKGDITLSETESMMRDISESMPNMLAADMVELADHLIGKGWGEYA